MSRAASRNLPLYLSAPHACSYLPARHSSTLFVDPDQPLDMATYDELLQFGFRRSGRLVYAPRCEFCQQCISVRLPVAEFSPRRAQRRVLKAAHNLRLVERPAAFDASHFALYQAYTANRHADGDMALASAEDYLGFLRADWSDTVFLELWLEEKLAAVAVTDRVASGLSAVYTFFDPTLSDRSPGTLAILQQVAWARRLSLPYLYLGYWIRDSRKMAYKADFRPIELWFEGKWRRFAAGDPLPN